MTVVAIHLGAEPERSFTAHLLGHSVRVTSSGVGSVARALDLVRGAADAAVVALDGFPLTLHLGRYAVDHRHAAEFRAAAGAVPLVDGSGIRDLLARQAIAAAAASAPGHFRSRRVLMAPALNHLGLAAALASLGCRLRYADPALLWGLPFSVRGSDALDRFATLVRARLPDLDYSAVSPPFGEGGIPRVAADFSWADIIAGDIAHIRRHAPYRLTAKTVITEHASAADRHELRARGVARLLLTMPCLGPAAPRVSAALVEAVLLALQPAGIRPSDLAREPEQLMDLRSGS